MIADQTINDMKTSFKQKVNNRNAPPLFLRKCLIHYAKDLITFKESDQIPTEAEKISRYRIFAIVLFGLFKHSCQIPEHNKKTHRGNYGCRKEPIGCLSYMFNSDLGSHQRLDAAVLFETILKEGEFKSKATPACIQFWPVSQILQKMKTDRKIGYTEIHLSNEILDDMIFYLQNKKLALNENPGSKKSSHIEEINKDFFQTLTEIGQYATKKGLRLEDLYLPQVKEKRSSIFSGSLDTRGMIPRRVTFTERELFEKQNHKKEVNMTQECIGESTQPATQIPLLGFRKFYRKPELHQLERRIQEPEYKRIKNTTQTNRYATENTEQIKEEEQIKKEEEPDHESSIVQIPKRINFHQDLTSQINSAIYPNFLFRTSPPSMSTFLNVPNFSSVGEVYSKPYASTLAWMQMLAVMMRNKDSII
jgi:hypothetical protein